MFEDDYARCDDCERIEFAENIIRCEAHDANVCHVCWRERHAEDDE